MSNPVKTRHARMIAQLTSHSLIAVALLLRSLTTTMSICLHQALVIERGEPTMCLLSFLLQTLLISIFLLIGRHSHIANLMPFHSRNTVLLVFKCIHVLSSVVVSTSLNHKVMISLASEVIILITQLILINIHLHKLLFAQHHTLRPILCSVRSKLSHIIVVIGKSNVACSNVQGHTSVVLPVS